MFHANRDENAEIESHKALTILKYQRNKRNTKLTQVTAYTSGKSNNYKLMLFRTINIVFTLSIHSNNITGNLGNFRKYH